MNNQPKGLRQQRRQEKLEMLLHHAAALLVEGGFEGLTMPRLAKRAKVAVGGIYRYFEDKQALYIALQVGAIQHLERFLADRSAEDPVEHVRVYVTGFSAFLDAYPMDYKLLDVAISDPTARLVDERAEVTMLAVEPVLAALDARIEAATSAGRLCPGPTRDRTYVLWGLAFGTLHRRKFERLSLPGPTAAELLVYGLDGVLEGWSHVGE